MMSRVIDTLQNGAREGIRVVNDAIDSAIYIDPEEQIETQALAAAKTEVDEKNSHIDKMNVKIDEQIKKTRERVDAFNKAFDKSITKTKEKIREVNKSDIMTAYRCARLVYYGNMAKDYMKEHPDWAEHARDKFVHFGHSAATKLRDLGISEYADENTEEICKRRDLAFGSPDALVTEEVIPDTDMMLQGVMAPEALTQIAELSMG